MAMLVYQKETIHLHGIIHCMGSFIMIPSRLTRNYLPVIKRHLRNIFPIPLYNLEYPQIRDPKMHRSLEQDSEKPGISWGREYLSTFVGSFLMSGHKFHYLIIIGSFLKWYLEHHPTDRKWFITMAGWWFGTWILFSHSVGNVIGPQLTKSIIFQRGRYTTNQS